jgi:hypothetical protein
VAFCRIESLIPVLQTLSAFHRHAPRNAFRHDARQLSKLCDLTEAQPAGHAITGFKGDLGNFEVVEHIRLIIDAGLIEGEAHPNATMSNGGLFIIEGLTWKGHDFLDAARSNTVWNATKGRLAKAGAWTFGLVLEVLKEETKRQLGLL